MVAAYIRIARIQASLVTNINIFHPFLIEASNLEMIKRRIKVALSKRTMEAELIYMKKAPLKCRMFTLDYMKKIVLPKTYLKRARKKVMGKMNKSLISIKKSKRKSANISLKFISKIQQLKEISIFQISKILKKKLENQLPPYKQVI